MQSSSREKKPRSIIVWFVHLGVLRGSTLVCFLFSVFIFSLSAEGASDTESARSVVKITAKSPDGMVSYATGFVWQQPTQVVTALHAVVGSEKITAYSEAQKKLSAAKIIRVHKESDLALLELERDLGLTPLNAETVDPNSLQEYYIWGYPHNVNTMQGDHIRFSRSLNQEQPTLKSILKVSDEMKEQLEQQGFPAIDVKILRVSSTIQPGHSGAPIFTKEGNVVGIGDGGLRGGVARINWAIPAEQYLPQLPDSTDEIPGQISLQAKLYSSQESVPADSSPHKITTTNNQSLKKVSTVTLSDIISTLPEENEKRQTLEEEVEDFKEKVGYGLEKTLLDIYDNPEVGVSLALPAGISVKAQGDLFFVSSKDYPIQMFVKISKSENMENALSEAEDFSETIRESDQWEEDQDSPDMKGCDDDDEWCFWGFSRVKYDSYGDPVKELTESWEIYHGDFLGAAIVTDLASFSIQQEEIYNLLIFCLDYLVTFSVH